MGSNARESGPSGIPGGFWIGAGIGFLLSAVAVIAAVEFSYRRRARAAPDGYGGYAQADADLVDDLSSAVSEGLSVLAAAARQVSDTFGAARRELIRFGLEGDSVSSGAGSSVEGWYFDDETEEPGEPAPEAASRPADSETHAAD
jgi:hypothetical protein